VRGHAEGGIHSADEEFRILAGVNGSGPSRLVPWQPLSRDHQAKVLLHVAEEATLRTSFTGSSKDT